MEKTKARGIKELNRYQIKGEKLTLRKAVLAMCAECCGRYADGALDCKISECPLYPWMVYRDTPVLSCRPHKSLTNEKRKELSDHLARWRKEKRILYEKDQSNGEWYNDKKGG